MDSISDPLPLGHFPEDFPAVMLPEPPSSGGGSSSFTALLGLPPEQAIELLHAVPDPRVKPEPAESGSPSPRRPLKRKDSAEPPKARPNGSKKGRGSDADEKLPYVHVRARRGQATDSHSLAERARREKINARMKLLQELVPGCSKISGTASVLDEIINHVQSLQRQVEFLSMRLAAVNPMFDCGVESFLSSDDLRLAGGNCGLRLIGNFDGTRHQQQFWQLDNQVATSISPSLWDRDSDHLHHEHPHAFLRCDAASRATVNSNQMKMEL